ncbi:MAG: putative DNA binding domain-containing protein [bacterium]|nr:putative DNA binding domain-containing protein [bacterium]
MLVRTIASLMSVDVSRITNAQKSRILDLNEGHFLDFKSRDIQPAKLSRTISAFANTNGGELYVGIEDDGEWRGFSDAEAANAHLAVFEGLFPLGQHFDYTFLENDESDGVVLQVAIQKTPDIKNASDGKPYIRRGAQSLPVTEAAALERLKLDKGLASFETQTVDAPAEVVENSTVLLEFLIGVVPTAEPLPWLEKQLLLRDGKPTVSGVLVFSEEPQAILPKRCGIKIYRYETSEEEGTRDTLKFQPLSIDGSAVEQIYAAVDKTVEIVEQIKIVGKKGLESIQYPRDALHEIITNAVLHRDYSIVSDIHIRLFDNRIEVESPGVLPGHVTPQNILNEQFARNGATVRLVNKFPNAPNKDVGEGLNTAYESMRKLRLKEPEIAESANSVIVYIRHERLASPEEAVLEYLDENEEINNRTARALSGITSENKMKEVFYRLRDRGLLEQVPGKKGSASAWRRPKRDGDPS